MKLLSKLIPRAMVTCALLHALFFPGATSSVLAADDGIWLRQEKMSPGGSYEFFFEANAGQTYPIAVSLDLLNWTLLTNAPAQGPSLRIHDEDASKFQQRFYRIGALPTPITNMVFIPPGTFTMGSPESEAGRDSKEGPQTVVKLSRGFWIGKYEVSQGEYISVMGYNISIFSTFGPTLPVDSATWVHATNYCRTLTEKERAAGRLPPGYSYRLPTEAEWEYACRAGTTTPFGIGEGVSLSSTQAHFDGTFPYGGAARGPYQYVTRSCGSYAPNAWGLHDMHGNVWEWCQDWYGPYPGGSVTDPKGAATGAARILRGGGYTSVGHGCRSARRNSHSPGYGDTIQGFRVVLAADTVSQ